VCVVVFATIVTVSYFIVLINSMCFSAQNSSKSHNDISKLPYLELIESIKRTDIVLGFTEPVNYKYILLPQDRKK
jgi:hypothetical protein